MNYNDVNTIQLTEADYFTKGLHNLVYRHPTDANCLIKLLGIVKVLGPIDNVVEINRLLSSRVKHTNWIGDTAQKRFINRSRLIKAHVREFTEIVRMRFCTDFLFKPPLFMEKVCGFVDTNLGFGMLVKAEKDRDGNIAPTLYSLIKDNKVDNNVRLQLDILYKQILMYDLVLCDLSLDNIVYAYSQSHGDHFVLIDGLGDKTFMPVCRWSTYLRKRMKLRKIKKIKEYVDKECV